MALTPAYEALHESAAVIDLTGRGHIRLTGEDRARLLHAMTTNHIQQLKPGESCYAFFLNAQGRMLSDAYVLCQEESLTLDVESGSRAFVMEHLDKFIIADDVELHDETESTAVLSVEGPRANEIAQTAGLDVTSAWPISYTGALALRFFVPLSEREVIVSKLQTAGALLATEADREAVRLEHGKPRYGLDLTSDHIPHEARLAGAVHFTKGCYLGQEIVERVRSRGKPNRMLTHFLIDAAEAVPAGSPMHSPEGKPIGEITSSAYSPAEAKVVGLGYVRTEFSSPGSKVAITVPQGALSGEATLRLA